MAKVALEAIVILALVVLASEGRKHHLEIRDDDRKFFPVSTFGFYVGGFLAVNITNFSVDNLHEASLLISDPTILHSVHGVHSIWFITATVKSV